MSLAPLLEGVVVGLAVGSIYALIAVGFTVLYKSTKILNLAHGELVLFGGYLAIGVTSALGFLPVPLAFAAGVAVTLVAAAALGFLVERAVMRPLFGQPLLSVIIVTLALGYVIRGVMVGVWSGETRTFPPVVPAAVVRVAGVPVSLVGVWSAAAAVVLLVAFSVFFRYSRWGIAMRAAANEQLTASTLGVSLRRVFAYAWAFAAVAGAVGGILLGLWLGVNFALAAVGLKALAAVILGGLDSVPGAILGGLLVGVVETVVGGYVEAHVRVLGQPLHGFKEVTAYLVILLALMARPYGLFGTEHIERLWGCGVTYARPCGDFKTSYAQDMSLLDVRLYRWGFVLLLGGMAAAPWVLGRWIYLLNDIAVFAIGAVGLSLVMGFAGQISLGHAAFMAVGAYTSWFVTSHLRLPFVVALPLSALVAFAVGAVVGLPSLRIKGLYLAIATLAFQFLVEYLIVQTVSGMGGTPVPPMDLFGVPVNTEVRFWYLVATVWVLGGVFAANLTRTRVGLALMAVRDRDYAAQVLGVNLLYYKTLAFALAAAYAGVAGSLFAHYNRVIGAEHFSLAQSIDFVAMLVIGGLGSVWGPHLGAAFVRTLTQLLKMWAPALGALLPVLGRATTAVHDVVFGAILIAFLVWEPGGLATLLRKLKRYVDLWPFPH